MASIEKRGDGWRVQVRRKGFPSEYATFPVRAQAVEWAATREAELVGARHGIIPRRTVRQALERYRDEVTPKHRGARWEAVRIGKFLGTPLKDGAPRAPSVPFLDRLLTQVAQHDLAAWRDASLVTLAPNSVRREYGVLRAVFAVALKEWGWLRQSPFDTVSPPAAGDARTRRVADAETAAIIAALGYKRGTRPETSQQFIAAAFLLALETMMRQGEILAATREDLNAPALILHVPKTKNGDARDVPLSPAALSLLKLLPKSGRLFPVSAATCDTLFRRARDAAGIEDLHFHDSRREATTRLAKKLDVLELARAGGWRDVNMLLRVYYRPSATDAAIRLR